MFGRSSFLTAEREEWHIEAWLWLMRNCQFDRSIQERPLVLPGKPFFYPIKEQGHERALQVFDQVKSIVGVSDWPVTLSEQNILPRQLNDGGPMLQHENAAAGTFIYEERQGHVTYDPQLLNDAIGLITVFAHELGHYYNGAFFDSVPGGDELYEPATDLTVAFLGFGLLGLGWRQYRVSGEYMTWGGGYLTEEEWIFATAMFAVLSKSDIETAKPYLKSGTWKLVKKAVKHIEKKEVIDIFVSEGLI